MVEGQRAGGGLVLQEVARSSRDATELLITLMDKLTGASPGENEQLGHLRFPVRPLPPRTHSTLTNQRQLSYVTGSAAKLFTAMRLPHLLRCTHISIPRLRYKC